MPGSSKHKSKNKVLLQKRVFTSKSQAPRGLGFDSLYSHDDLDSQDEMINRSIDSDEDAAKRAELFKIFDDFSKLTMKEDVLEQINMDDNIFKPLLIEGAQ